MDRGVVLRRRGTRGSSGRLILAGGLLVAGALVRGGPVSAADEPGLGQASGQLLRIEPTSAGLAFGVVIGPVSSDHRNEVARAVAQSTNFEHDMPLIRGLADRLVALELGAVVAVGTPDEVLQHPRVVESYLGTSVPV